MISFTWASLSEHRGPSGKKEKLCQAVSQKAKHRNRERAARWCWQCCNTGSGSLWNGFGAYIGNKTSSLHESLACACVLVIPALSLCIHCCAIRGVSSRNTCDTLLSTEPCVGGWRCPEGFVRSAAPAPLLSRAARPRSSPDSLPDRGGGQCVSQQPEVLTGLAAGSSTA